MSHEHPDLVAAKDDLQKVQSELQSLMLKHRCLVPTSQRTRNEIIARGVPADQVPAEVSHDAWYDLYYIRQPKQSLKRCQELSQAYPDVAEAAAEVCTRMIAAIARVEAARTVAKADKTQRAEQRKAAAADRKALGGVKAPAHIPRDVFDRARATLRAAIDPQFPGYRQAIFDHLRSRVDHFLELLEEHKGDALAASLPSGYTLAQADGYDPRVPSWVRKSFSATRAELRKWTVQAAMPKGMTDLDRDPSRNKNAVDMRRPKSDAMIDFELMKQATEIARHDFEAYATKLAGKIGLSVERASVIGKLWQRSILVAHIEESFWDDTLTNTQRWSTQMILNTSKLGKLFNQWPTRRIDRDAKA